MSLKSWAKEWIHRLRNLTLTPKEKEITLVPPFFNSVRPLRGSEVCVDLAMIKNRNMDKNDSLFNPTLCRGTYLYSPYMEVPSPYGVFQSGSLKGKPSASIGSLQYHWYVVVVSIWIWVASFILVAMFYYKNVHYLISLSQVTPYTKEEDTI